MVADIKRQMGEDEEEGKPTALEAFQMISEAVDEANNRKNATEAYNQLPPILRKLVRTPSWLVQWHNTDENAFNTVIMSAIRESYKELAKRETKYHTLPEGIRKKSAWRIEGSDPVALPEPEQEKKVEDLLDEMERWTEDYRAENGIVPNESYSDRVAEFLKPVTKADIARVEFRDQQKMERMKE